MSDALGEGGGGGRDRERRGGGGGGGGGDRRQRRDGGGGGGRDRRGNNRRDRQRQQQDHEYSASSRPIILAKPDRAQRDREFPTLQQATTGASSSSGAAAKQSQDSEDSGAAAAAGAAAGAVGERRRTDSPLSQLATKSTPTPPSSQTGRQGSGLPRRDEDASGESAGAAGAKSGSPAAAVTAASAPATATAAAGVPHQERACKFVDDSHQVSDNLSSFLTDNTDLLVVGVLGPQGAGKSTVLNALVGDREGEAKNADVFRVQSFEKQMLAEHCTNGINAWVSPGQRVLYLDCQPLSSPSVLDRAARQEKRYPPEFSTSEATADVHSLQHAGFLLNVCHVVLLVQDWPADPNVVRALLAAEMLKPSSPCVESSGGSGEDDSGGVVVEHLPDLVVVHNKARLEDFEPERIARLARFYDRALGHDSQLRLRSGLGIVGRHVLPHLRSLPSGRDKDLDGLNLFILPDFEFGGNSRGFAPGITFEGVSSKLRRQVLSAARRPLTTSPKMTERGWFQFAQKSWENVKNSSFYMEYNRML